MLTRRVLLGGLLTAGCGRGAGVTSPVAAIDFSWADLVQQRNAFERVIHLTGDSIFRGRAIGAFADLVTPEYPLYRFRSISSIANAVLAASGSTDRFVYMFPIDGHGSINADDIRDYIAANVIRSGDVVITEDAGGHSKDPDAYEAFWDGVRAAISDTLPINSIMMDMFDFPDGSNLASAVEFQYERTFGSRTMNDATRAAARKPQAYPGQTTLLPMRRIITDYRSSVMAEQGFNPCDRDGIHLRVWAQMKMTGVLCRAAGAHVSDVRGLVGQAIENLSTLRYGSSTFDAAAAERYVREALLDSPTAI